MDLLRKINQWLNKFEFVFACLLTGGMFGYYNGAGYQKVYYFLYTLDK